MFNNIIIALINFIIISIIKELGIYTTFNFNTYLLLKSIILNNRGAIYLINNILILILGLFKKSFIYNIIKIGTASYPIFKRGTRVIKGLFIIPNKKCGNLILNNIIIVEDFYINIIFKALLLK